MQSADLHRADGWLSFVTCGATMENRTFWFGLMGGAISGVLIVAAGYFVIKAYLSSQEGDPLYKMKQSFLPSATSMWRTEVESEIFFLYRERKDAPALLTS